MRHTRQLIVLLCSACFAASAMADVDLSGFWEPLGMEDFQAVGSGPDLGDYTGLPLSEEGRERALSYSAAQLSVPERQCISYPPHYLVLGPFSFRLSPEVDPLTGYKRAWRISPWLDRPETIIWMDGRTEPEAEALHTFGGFTSGVWEAGTLTTFSRHFKEGPVRRNGVPTSDRGSVTMHFTRHGDYLQVTAIIEDPIYLTAPYVISRVYRSNPHAFLKNDNMMTCNPATESVLDRGTVSHNLPGADSGVDEFSRNYNIPYEATMGGAETMYPEYRRSLQKAYKLPTKYCDAYCCGWGDGRDPLVFNRVRALRCPGMLGVSPEILNLVDDSASQ